MGKGKNKNKGSKKQQAENSTTVSTGNSPVELSGSAANGKMDPSLNGTSDAGSEKVEKEEKIISKEQGEAEQTKGSGVKGNEIHDPQQDDLSEETTNNTVNDITESDTNDNVLKSNEEVTELQKEIRDLKQQLDSQNTKFNEATERKDTELAALKKQLEDSECKVAELESSKCSASADDSEDSAVADLQKQLELKTLESKEYKENYDSLLRRLSQMKAVFSKMKEAEGRLNDVESENAELKAQLEESTAKCLSLEASVTELKNEVINLNSECDRLTDSNSELKAKLESQDFELENESKKLEDENKSLKKELREAKSNLEEYLILIQEEKMSKTTLNQEISDLKVKFDEVSKIKSRSEENNTELKKEISLLMDKVSSAEKAKEELVSKHQTVMENVASQLNQLKSELDECKQTIENKDSKISTFSTLEAELKEKQLLVGKLRHETITLNEHLTKAMKLIKKESSKETVDRELVSNLFISFLQIPRGDPKKFEVLRLLSNFLDWDDDKKRHAGLISAGSYKSHSNSVVEIPTLDRSLSQSNAQSFVSLWTEFLEKESTPRDKPI